MPFDDLRRAGQVPELPPVPLRKARLNEALQGHDQLAAAVTVPKHLFSLGWCRTADEARNHRVDVRSADRVGENLR